MINHLKKYFLLLFLSYSFTPVYSQDQAFASYAEALSWARSSAQDLELALPIFDQFIGSAQAAGYVDTAALFIHYKAVKYYKHNIDSALAINARAIQMRMRLGDREGASRSYYNQGLFYQAKHSAEGVQQSFEAILDLGYGKDNPMFVSSSYRLSQGERERGDYERALHYLDIAFQPLQEEAEKTQRDSTNLGLLHHAYGTIYNQMGDSLLSVQAREHLQAEIHLYQALGLDNRLAAAHFELGSAYENLHQYDSSIYFFEKAKLAYARLEDDEMVNNAQNNLSIPLRKLGRYVEALRLLQAGLRKHQVAFGLGAHPAQARLYDNMGEVYLAKGEVEKALWHFQQAIANVVPFAAEDVLTSNPSRQDVEDLADKEDLLTYLRDKARAWQVYYQQEPAKEHLQQALATLSLADYVVDLMRSEHLDAESKLFWRKQVHQIYEEGLSICYALGDSRQAYYFLEKSKAVLLLDALMEMDTRKWIDPHLAEREVALHEQLITWRQALPTTSQDADIRRNILNAQNQLQVIRDSIREQYPEYFGLRYKTAQIAAEDFLSQLEANTSAVQFFWGESYVYILPITKERAELFRVETRLIKPLLFQYLAYFDHAAAILAQPLAYQESAYELYRLLLAPVLSTVPSQKLILMPDGLLHNLPFEALITQIHTDAGLGNWSYLQKKYQLSYAYSATILSKQMRPKADEKQKGERILGMAPFAEEGNENWGALAYSGAEVAGLPALHLAGAFRVGETNNYEYFLQHASDFGVLHLSTHAAVNAKEGEPFIDFRDARLYLRDLYRLQLPVNLVVLSACQTNLGELKRGEGVMSLNRGFTYAGAKSLISSLWSVNDRATTQVFAEFYRQLKAGLSKAEALHAAKQAYLANGDLPEEEKSPYYWAGFIHYGDDSPVTLARSVWGPAAWLFLGGMALLVGLFLGVRRRATN